MKIYNYLNISLLLILSLSGCEKAELSMPVSQVEVSKNEYTINESVIFKFTGQAQKVSIFTGDDTHNFELINQGNKGFVINKNTFSYAYKQPGTYKVVIVASNLSEGAQTILKDTCSLLIQVIDDDATIKALSCPKVLYDEISAENINETDWLVRLPQKILFTGKTATITSKQRLAVKLASDSTELLVNGTKFNTSTQYELKTPLTLNLRAHSGSSKEYNLYMLRYPEFSVFKLAGVSGVITRSEFNYNKMTINVTLPAGTDKSGLVPEFTISEGQEAFVNNVLQTSGATSQNFSSPVVFRLRNTLADKPHLFADTEITVIAQ